MSTPGRRIADRYRLERELAVGGFGRIWQAHDERLAADVVVKEMRLAPAFDPGEHSKQLKYAEREALHAAELRGHPHIVPIYDVVIEDDRPWIVMELVRGSSLANRLAKGPLTPKEVADVAEAMLKALDAAHEKDIVHRDVKPANIMLGDDGRILLTDFGIAARQGDTRLTTVGNVIGTPEYLAPERINGAEAGPASDLFALGVTLYQAIEGVSPFKKASPTATLVAVATHPPPPMKKADGLEPLILGLLNKDPGERLTATVALEKVRSWRTASKPEPPQPPEPPKKAGRIESLISGTPVALEVLRGLTDAIQKTQPPPPPARLRDRPGVRRFLFRGPLSLILIGPFLLLFGIAAANDPTSPNHSTGVIIAAVGGTALAVGVVAARVVSRMQKRDGRRR